MGFCTPDEHRLFLRQAPVFERMLIEDGIILIKYWFSVSDEEQEKRFRSGSRTRCGSGSSRRWTSSRRRAGSTTRGPRTRCSSTPTCPARPGTWSSRTRSATRGSTASRTCSATIPYERGEPLDDRTAEAAERRGLRATGAGDEPLRARRSRRSAGPGPQGQERLTAVATARRAAGYGSRVAPQVGIPRLPVGPDPFRRIKVPSELERDHDDRRGGARRPPAASARPTSSGSGRPSRASTAAACTRRSASACGARARSSSTARIGWAKGVGPEAPDDAERVPNTPATPHVIFSASKAMTACVAHLLDQQEQDPHRRPRRRVHPRVREPRQGGDHDRARALAQGRRPEPARARRSRSRTSTTARRSSRSSATRSRSRGRASRSPTTRSPAATSSARSSTGSPASRSARCWPSEILDPLGFRWTNYGVAAADVDAVATQPLHRRAGAAAALEPAQAGARASSVGDAARLANEPEFLTGVDPGRQRGDDRERALALLRAAAPRRRARRRPRSSNRARSGAVL